LAQVTPTLEFAGGAFFSVPEEFITQVPAAIP
jgi:hypothetical protein